MWKWTLVTKCRCGWRCGSVRIFHGKWGGSCVLEGVVIDFLRQCAKSAASWREMWVGLRYPYESCEFPLRRFSSSKTESKWIFYLSSRYYCLSAIVNSRWTVSKTLILITPIYIYNIYYTHRYNEWDLYSVMFVSFVDVNNMSTKTTNILKVVYCINQHIRI